MGKIIAFANQKGGVGKTTSAVNIAASVGILGKSVLLIDLDPQGNTTSGVGINKKNLKSTSYELLIDEIDAAQAIVETEFKNLSVIPSNISLAGAEFGVYVYSSEGKLTPWANPLLPSEPMRIRTGETETRFSLPQGTEFYLRQESAPEGYIFDAQTLIPVTDSEIVVRNQAYGRVTISVRDTLGEGIEGVSLTATDGAGNQTELVTEENGQAVLLCDHAGAYAIAESGLPEGVLPAENDSVQVQAAPGSAAEAAFEHPAPGLVQAAATLVSVNALGEQEEKPLAGLALCVAGQTATTDADGAAESAGRHIRCAACLHG